MALDIISFGQNDIDNVLKGKPAAEVDKLAFGAIQLNSTGKIVQHNAA